MNVRIRVWTRPPRRRSRWSSASCRTRRLTRQRREATHELGRRAGRSRTFAALDARVVVGDANGDVRRTRRRRSTPRVRRVRRRRGNISAPRRGRSPTRRGDDRDDDSSRALSRALAREVELARRRDARTFRAGRHGRRRRRRRRRSGGVRRRDVRRSEAAAASEEIGVRFQRRVAKRVVIARRGKVSSTTSSFRSSSTRW